MAETKLIFRTSPGSDTITANSTQRLANNIIVKNYPEIRLLCGNRNSSKSAITLDIILIEGNELIGSLDSITLQPGDSYTTIYPIPGTKISILAKAGDGDAYIDLFIYAYDPNSKSSSCSNLCY